MDWTTAKWLLKRMDWFLALAVLLLLGTGIAFVYSASYRGDDLPVPGFYRRQMLWAALGVAVFLAFMLTDYRSRRRGLVLRREPRAPGPRAGHGQEGVRGLPLALRVRRPCPALRVAKLALIIMLARFLGRPGRDLQHPGTLVRALILLAVPFALIVKEPDPARR